MLTEKYKETNTWQVMILRNINDATFIAAKKEFGTEGKCGEQRKLLK